MLGAVSEIGETPTGAVIERGSNVNGEYVRFADGTQICTHKMVTSASAAVLWTYPITFLANADAVLVTPVTSTPSIAHANGFGQAFDILINGYDTIGTRQAFDISVPAQGRWY